MSGLIGDDRIDRLFDVHKSDILFTICIINNANNIGHPIEKIITSQHTQRLRYLEW